MKSPKRRGQPVKRDEEGSREFIHLRIPRDNKRFLKRIAKIKGFRTLTDLILESVNEKYGYVKSETGIEAATDDES